LLSSTVARREGGIGATHRQSAVRECEPVSEF
jgi:hypothetical protein